jgi:hypothetical protein
VAESKVRKYLRYGLGVLLVGSFATIMFKVCVPPGDLVCTIDMTAAEPTCTFDANAGDRIALRADVAGPHGRKTLTPRLEQSTLTFSIVSPGTPESSARCPMYGGMAASSTGGSESMQIDGIVLGCEVSAGAAGKQTVRASVQWSEGTRVTLAKLHVRRVKK